MAAVLSVIIPCYNSKDTLEECVRSVLQSQYPDVEIILVDDGSTDNTWDVMNYLVQIYSDQVHAYHKKNEGLGKARNYGIRYATGQLITFIDSDDYIDSDTYSTMIGQMGKDASDVVYCGFRWVYPDRNKEDLFNCKPLYDNIDEFLQYVLDKSKTYAGISACTGIYKAELIHKMGMSFLSEREYLSEDKLFNFCYLKHACRVSVVPHVFYNYVQHSRNTLTSTFKNYLITAAYNFCQYMLSAESNNKTKMLICCDFLINLSACLQRLIPRKGSTFKSKLDVIREIEFNDNYLVVIRASNPKAMNFPFRVFRRLLILHCTLGVYLLFWLKNIFNKIRA